MQRLFPELPLAFRAKMSAPLANQDPLDLGATARAGFARALVGFEMILEFAAAIDPVDAGAVAANALV